MSSATIRWLAVCIAVIGRPAVSLGDERLERARALFHEGNRLHDQGKFEEALAKFRAAHRLHPTYRIELNIADTLDKMGRQAEAASALERFLEHAPAGAELVAEASQRLRELKRALARLQVRCAMPDANVRLDGQWLGPSQQARSSYVKPGRHVLTVSKRGYQTHRAELDLGAGTEKSVDVRLLPEPAAAPPLPVARLPRPEPRDLPRPRTRAWAYSTLALGVALGISAGVFYGVGKSEGDAAFGSYMEARAQPDMDAYWQSVESAKGKVIAGHVMAGAATVALGVSVYLFVAARARRQAVRQPGATAGLGPRGVQVAW